MSDAFQHYARRVMSGAQTGARAALLRAALAAAELPYAVAVNWRNRRFDRGIREPTKLLRPVISVGNITAGGTGKTPVVRWLAERLRDVGKTVAVLSRGYKASPGELGDEQRMLAGLLNRAGEPLVVIGANPDRVRAGEQVLREHPGVNVFILDDGFQHRRLARDFDLVLVSAPEPFGFGRVLPRGLLREPLRGLSRATAFLLTRADEVSESDRTRGIQTLREHNPGAPVYQCRHAPTCFRHAENVISLDALPDRRWFAFSGIGQPESFLRRLIALGGTHAGHRHFADHHEYAARDLERVCAEAASVNADVLITTEKDWVKASKVLPSNLALPVWRLDVEIHFDGDDEARLLTQINTALDRRG